MSKKIIIEADGIRKEFVGPDFGRRMRMMRHMNEMENEVKLFTDKSKMVEYVNQLTGIENVEIFKIEDNLYKVLVSKKKKQDEKCCQEHHHEEKCCHEEETEHKCCHEEEKEHKCCHEDEHEGNENR